MVSGTGKPSKIGRAMSTLQPVPRESVARHLRVVVLEGSPHEIGLAHGRLLGPEIQFLIQQLHALVFRRLGFVQGTGARIVARALAIVLDRHSPPRLRDEMRAIAAGSGVPYPNTLLINTLDDVLNLIRQAVPAAPSVGCSSFALFGPRTSDGGVLHGRNLDYHFRNTPIDDNGAVSRMLLRHAILFVHRPKGAAQFVSVGWPGMAGVATAVNDRGISLGNLTSYLRAGVPWGTASTMRYRLIMEEASSLDDVRRLLRSSRGTVGNNLMVGSGREARAALFELTPGTVAEVPPHDGVLVATNHFQTPELARRQARVLLPHSVRRWERLRELCGHDAVEPEEALGFLADTACGVESPATNLFHRVANEGTAVSALFRPGTLEMWIGVAPEPPASSRGFRRLELEELLKLPAGLSAV